MDKMLFDLKYVQEILMKLSEKGMKFEKCLPSIDYLEFSFIGLYGSEELKILKKKVGENL